MATLGEIVPPRERGKYMGYFMVVMMLATVGGPLVGGWITEAISWRWIFYINLPLGGAALVYLMATLKVPARRVEHRIDYLGGTLLGVVATAVILVATWGGTQYGWGSLPVIAADRLAVVALLAFLMVERRAAEPMLPLHVFKIRNFSLSMGLTILRRPRAVRRDDVPPALPADRAGGQPDGERPADDADDARLRRHLDAGRLAGHRRPASTMVPRHRRRGHGSWAWAC